MQASELFSDHFLEHVLAQDQIRYEPLDLLVLVAQLPQLSQLRHSHASELPAPRVERLRLHPIFRQISHTGVPDYACLTAYATCSRVPLPLHRSSVLEDHVAVVLPLQRTCSGLGLPGTQRVAWLISMRSRAMLVSV